ncbi:MAG TPA: response regulator [Usitatibacter sp.]|jgi:CheY-like chemotaxis protein|nr:response regulator [Usitatibacter sp.]
MVRILLVDDNPSDVAQGLEALRAQGFSGSVRVARGGQEALDFLLGRGQFQDRRRHPLPDLVLLDLNMPRVDGFRVLRQMRRCESLKRIPVVALCGSAEEALRAVAGEVRANDCIVKPLAAADVERLSLGYRNWTLRLDLPEESPVQPAWPRELSAPVTGGAA